MKKLKTEKLTKKIIYIIIVLMLCNFIIPNNIAYAAKNGDSGSIFQSICKCFAVVCDSVMQFLQDTLTTNQSIKKDDGTYDFQYSPAIIFSGKVPAFDVNFINPNQGNTSTDGVKSYILENEGQYRMTNGVDENEYNQLLNNIKNQHNDGELTNREYMFNGDYRTTLKYDIYYHLDNKATEDENDDVLVIETIGAYGTKVGDDIVRRSYGYGRQEVPTKGGTINGAIRSYESIAQKLQKIIATWYNALRRIALVGLLSALVYVGIQIVLTSMSGKENSKYKKMLTDWIIAIILLFTLHYIMSVTITVTSKISNLFANGKTDNLLNTLREKIDQAKTWEEVTAEVIMYGLMVIYTIAFSFQYLKRVLYMAFFTLIAPLITLTYPLDKIKDGKAQAFTMWIKEYVFNASIQIVHLVLYFTLVGSALSLVEVYPLYGILAIGFMTRGEKIIRKMFGFNNAETVGAFEAAATGALIATAIKKLTSHANQAKNKTTSEDKANNKIRTASNTSSSGGGVKGGAEALAEKYGIGLGKSVVKTGVKAGLAAQGALWGFAGGAATGDIGAALKGGAAGATAGGAIGNRITQGVDTSKIQHAVDNFKDTWNSGAHGEQFAKNASEARIFKRTGDYKELLDKYGDNLTDDKLRAMMQAGITDKKNMDKVLSSENMADAIGYYALAKKCPDEIYYDDEKLQMYLQDLGLEQNDAEIMRKNMRSFR